MNILEYLALGFLVLLIAGLFRWIVFPYYRLRGARAITCPETREVVGVEIDARRAAIAAVFGKSGLQIGTCSRWPMREGCGQVCLSQIEAAPDGCLMRNILSDWYLGKTCVLCGMELGDIDWTQHKPALMSPERKTIEWDQVVPQNIQEVLKSHMPICWNCFIAEDFRGEHSDLIVDNPWQN